MRIAKIICLGTAALAIVGSGAFSTASAQQERSGTVTEINRLNGTLAIRQTQDGTVGASSGGSVETFKVQGGMSLDDLHAGDRVGFTATDTGASKTITKIQKQ
jgi:Copper binding periplasmic protein CusF